MRRISHHVLAAAVAAVLLLPATAPADGENNFVVNGTFDSNINNWVPFVPGQWLAAADRASSPASGGLEMRISASSNAFNGGGIQCVKVVPGISYTTVADIRVPTLNQNPGTTAGLHRVYFDSDNCTNNQLASTGAGNTIADDLWYTRNQTHTAPVGAFSMWLYLRLTKTATPTSAAYAYYDNVRLHALLNADGDSCRDGEELGPTPSFGGDRDPFYAWDFFDVNATRDIDLADTLLILDHFGLLPDDRDYDALYDRYIPDDAKPWRTAQATGDHLGIDLQDALANLQSFGHTCYASFAE